MTGGNRSIICNAAEGEITRSERNDENCAVSTVSEVMPDLENVPSESGNTTAQKELISGVIEACSRPMIHNNRRIHFDLFDQTVL